MTIGILFDLDGTLLNTLEDLKDATNYALSSLGYPERSLEEVRRFVGNGAGRLMAQAVPAGVDSAEALARFPAFPKLWRLCNKNILLPLCPTSLTPR